jgi:trehalose/maltose transport system substrate-binding protein
MTTVFNRLLTSVAILLGVLALPVTTINAQTDELSCPEGQPELVIAAGALGGELELLNRSLQQYMELCPNVTVTALETPDLVTDRLGLYIQFLGARSDAVDIYSVDVIWPAIVAEHMVDYYDYVEPSSQFVSQHPETLIQNNTVDERLIAMPWYTDLGLLYYRTDLLEKYDLGVPQTWDELAESARIIQEGERAEGNSEFYGYVWQGALGEATMVNGLEWQAAEGGGVVISPEGEVQVFNEPTIQAVERAASWVGDISPSNVIAFTPEDSREIWQAGNAAFMRNWTYAYNEAAQDELLAGNFGVAPLPAGDAGVAATLGGWSLAVSQYSNNVDAAMAITLFLTSAEQQKFRALEGGFAPTALSVYDDPEIQENSASPLFEQLFTTLSTNSATPRPSTVAGDLYNDVSREYANAVHSVLRGEQDARIALDDLEFELEDIVIELGF